MKTIERTAVYALLALCLVLALSARFGHALQARADDPASPSSAPVKIAVCDVFGVTEKLVESPRFKPDRESEEQRIRERLEPMQRELADLQREIEGMDPTQESTQIKIREFRAKREAAAAIEQQAAIAFRGFIARQFLEAFEIARQSAVAVAERAGYTHVIASRDPSKKIETLNPERIVEAFLGRPVLMSPKGTDITDDLLADLRLD
ncbi:MAG: OmpH family outer membrane protein [Phycisphaeraceae bacterium]|nr:OmpH family outer membrane protein [Phycisphaeraceae bacterium]